jgi:integrase/recombinase XerD
MSNNALLVENFLEMMAAERSASFNTLQSYKRDLEDMVLYCNKQNMYFESLQLMDIEAYISYIKGKNNYSSATMARKISAIKQFYNFLFNDEIINSNPCQHLSSPKTVKSLPKALTQEQTLTLLEVAAKDQSDEGLRLHLILELMYSTGMRVTELIRSKLGDIQFAPEQDSGYMIVRGKGGKERMVVLNVSCLDVMEKYMEVHYKFARGRNCDWLFPSFTKQGKLTYISRQRLGQLLKNLALKAGFDPELVSPHKLRHSFATHLIQNGADVRIVQELLGHADISSTQIYTKVFSEEAEKLVMEKHPLSYKGKVS